MIDLDDLEKDARYSQRVLDLIARCRKAEARVAELEAQSEPVGTEELVTKTSRKLGQPNIDCTTMQFATALIRELYVSRSVLNEPLQRLGKRLSDLLDEDQWAECESLLLASGAQYGNKLYLRAPQAVPADVVKDAGRYRWLTAGDGNNALIAALASVCATDGPIKPQMDSAIDAAMADAPSPEGE